MIGLGELGITFSVAISVKRARRYGRGTSMALACSLLDQGLGSLFASCQVWRFRTSEWRKLCLDLYILGSAG